MKVGEMYTVQHKWALPRGNDPKCGYEFWSNCGPLVYLGEQTLVRDDGRRIINYTFLADGQHRIVDRSFLRFLEIVK